MNNTNIKSPYVDLLLNAIRDQNLDLVKQILQTKNLIKIHEINQISNTAFDYLAVNGNFEIAILLINHGFKLKIEQTFYKTPLHRACEFGNLNIVQLLINSFHMKLDLKDERNMTPLHWAVEYGHYDIINYILNNHLNQIDFNSVDKFNRTVHELALIKRNNKIINLVEEKIKYKMKLDQENNKNNNNNVNNFFNKTQFNIKSFAKPVKTLLLPQNSTTITTPTTSFSTTVNSNVNINQSNQTATTTKQKTQPFSISKAKNDDFLFDLDEDLLDIPPALNEHASSSGLSLSPNSRHMNDTLSWLENQIFTKTNTNLNCTNNFNHISSIDILDEIKNGKELVLTEAGKELLEMTDDSESTKNLLLKLAKSFENNNQNVNSNPIDFDLNKNKDEDDDDDHDDVSIKTSKIHKSGEVDEDDDLFVTNVVKRCRFSTASPKPQTNQFDIDLDSFLNNFLNSR